MRNASNAASRENGDIVFASPSKAAEGAAFDSLPRRLRRALDAAAREYSAVELRMMIDGGDYAVEDVAEGIAEIIEQDTARIVAEHKQRLG